MFFRVVENRLSKGAIDFNWLCDVLVAFLCCVRYLRVTETLQRLATKHAGERIIIVCHAGILDDIYRRAEYVFHHSC